MTPTTPTLAPTLALSIFARPAPALRQIPAPARTPVEGGPEKHRRLGYRPGRADDGAGGEVMQELQR